MTILKNGTPTGFQDKNGKDIKTADRIKHTLDGSILTIDKFGRAVSALGFTYQLTSLAPISNGMNEDGTYYSRLSSWEVTDEPAPAKPEGETVKPGDDSQNMAPARVRDPRDTSKYKTKRHEEEAVKNGGTVEQARRILTLQDFQDEELCAELRERGYKGEITKTKTIKI